MRAWLGAILAALARASVWRGVGVMPHAPLRIYDVARTRDGTEIVSWIDARLLARLQVELEA